MGEEAYNPFGEVAGEGLENTPPREKGKWLDTVGSVLDFAPEVFCTLFPDNCVDKEMSTGNTQAPIIVQQQNQRDWLTIALIVVVLVILLILILKK